MRVKVISDGTNFGTYLANAETGERLDVGNLIRLKVEVSPETRETGPVVTVEFARFAIEMEGRLVNFFDRTEVLLPRREDRP